MHHLTMNWLIAIHVSPLRMSTAQKFQRMFLLPFQRSHPRLLHHSGASAVPVSLHTVYFWLTDTPLPPDSIIRTLGHTTCPEEAVEPLTVPPDICDLTRSRHAPVSLNVVHWGVVMKSIPAKRQMRSITLSLLPLNPFFMVFIIYLVGPLAALHGTLPNLAKKHRFLAWSINYHQNLPWHS